MIFGQASFLSSGVAQALRAFGIPVWWEPTGRRIRALDEGLVLDYIEKQLIVSETPTSLAQKLDVHEGAARRMLDYLARRGQLRCRTFDDIEPVYYRYPSLDL